MDNPWNVQSIQEFQFFNCPECDSQIKNSQDFIKHAVKDHEQAKDSLCMKSELSNTKIKMGLISIVKRKVDEISGSSPDSKVQKLESMIEKPNQDEYKDEIVSNGDDESEMSDDQKIFLCYICDEVCSSKSYLFLIEILQPIPNVIIEVSKKKS